MPFPLRPRRVTPGRASASSLRPSSLPARPAVLVDILPELLPRLGHIRPLRESLRLWSLVLEARGVEHRVRDAPGSSHGLAEGMAQGWALEVLEPLAPRAVDEIAAFERENRGRRRQIAPGNPPSAAALPGALAVVLGLICMHGLTVGNIGAAGAALAHRAGLPDSHDAWIRLGGADARLMVHFGEWYRAVTALTLHAGPEHLGANACLGGIFLVLAGRELGLGVALCLTILSGMLGNMLNAWFHGAMHLSIGASTAVFGLLGALTTHRTLVMLAQDVRANHGWARERPALAWARVFAPLAAGVILLGLFGTGGGEGPSGPNGPGEPGRGGRTDVLAHLFGFVAGVGLGWILHRYNDWSRRTATAWALGLGSLGLVVAAWIMALR